MMGPQKVVEGVEIGLFNDPRRPRRRRPEGSVVALARVLEGPVSRDPSSAGAQSKLRHNRQSYAAEPDKFGDHLVAGLDTNLYDGAGDDPITRLEPFADRGEDPRSRAHAFAEVARGLGRGS
jgi:hypothetical protein